ncbi:c-type cytochrome domain-containing protein [Tautonia marina]|uniref:c-type cytochrome domain-containing protein n=1 Tax=Tautonia marina TaxID=2653855 RepID=UPI0012611E1F|nr:c-type cytochrome domain-containing protein [Tautonia marina]
MMQPNLSRSAWTLTFLLGATCSHSVFALDDPEGKAFFEAKIRPVLIEHCFACHSSQAKPPKAGFRVDTRSGLRRGGDSGSAIEPGRPDDSLLIRVLEHTSEIAMMPPGSRLPDAVLDDFRAWIERGAPDPRPDDPPR